MQVEALHDHDELESFLARDRVGNAYLIGDLDQAYAPFCRWFGCRNDEGEQKGQQAFHGGRVIEGAAESSDQSSMGTRCPSSIRYPLRISSSLKPSATNRARSARSVEVIWDMSLMMAQTQLGCGTVSIPYLWTLRKTNLLLQLRS